METNSALLGQTHAAFRFVVEIGQDKVAAFTECTLPVLDWQIEELKEGGQNMFVHQLPGPRKTARLTLKNGVGKTVLWEWCTKIVSAPFRRDMRKTITVKLLDGMGHDLTIWRIENAYPIKWTGPQLQSNSTSVAIQSVEFACGYVSVELG